MATGLQIERPAPAVVVATIARPPDNAFTVEMCRELSSLLTHPPEGAHLLRLRADGPAFCRGREPSPGGAPAARTMVAALTDVTRGLAETSLVTIAEVDGDAAGFGVGLVAQCDVAVASSRSRFWFPEVSRALAPALVLSWLPRTVGRRQAFWLTASGSTLGAAEAQQLGLVNFVVEPAALAARVDEVMATLSQYPAAVHAEIKRDLRDFDQAGPVAAYRMAGDRLLWADVAGDTAAG